jgi:hypothetical protein
MVPASDPDLDPRLKARLDRALGLARAAMLVERGAAVWAPLALAVGVIAVAGLWGAFDGLSFAGHAAAVALILLAGAGFGALGVRALRAPTREEIQARLEADSGLTHAPLSALDDVPAAGDPGLWALHRARSMQALASTRVRLRPGLAKADPFALRYLLVVAAVMGLWARGLEQAPRAGHAFKPVGVAAQVSVSAMNDAVNAVAGWFRPRRPAPLRVKAPAPAGGGLAVKSTGGGG